MRRRGQHQRKLRRGRAVGRGRGDRMERRSEEDVMGGKLTYKYEDKKEGTTLQKS